MKAELKNGVNQIIKGTNIFEEGDAVKEVALVIKGRIQIKAQGVNMVVGSGNFLGLCDIDNKVHHVTYIADMNAVVYSFPVQGMNATIRALVKANKDYAPLMVSTLSKYVRELSKIYEELVNGRNALWDFLKSAYEKYQEIGKKTEVKTNAIRAIEQLDADGAQEEIDLDMVEYYRACAEVSTEAQKAYFGASMVITMHHIAEEVALINTLLQQCRNNAEELRKLAEPLVKADSSLYMNVLQQVTTLQHMGSKESNTDLFDDVIDRINSLENLLYERAGIDLEIDHDFMEEAYFELLNGSGGGQSGSASLDLAITEGNDISVDALYGALDEILSYGELEQEEEEVFRNSIEEFRQMSDKFATTDEARTLRRNIQKIYYVLYKKVFLKDYHSKEETPVVIDLFLRFGYLSEKLVSEKMLEELLMLDDYHSGIGSCQVYDMKEWFTLVLEGKKEPSKSEFDMDYDESLRDMRKTGQITPQQQDEMARDLNAKFDYEVQNLFRTNHRLMASQITAFVPFLYTEGCSMSLERSFLSKDKVNASVQKIQQIDYSVFYREILYAKQGSPFAKEYIQTEVYPDIILFPGCGNKGIMWQELSGRRRTSKGRFLFPVFMEGDLEGEVVKVLGRFRWELCRTIQGSAWNNIQIKSLTSEYSDFVQFYRKNRDLSEDRKEKLKLQIQKCRNSTREVFVVDYDNWIRHEAQGGMCLSKPVREIMATYCPFAKEMRERLVEMPMYRDAMARFNRENGKKIKEYDLKFRVWEKDGVEVPPEVIHTKEFYTEK